jgi:hypothetical protein
MNFAEAVTMGSQVGIWFVASLECPRFSSARPLWHLVGSNDANHFIKEFFAFAFGFGLKHGFTKSATGRQCSCEADPA